MHRVRKFAQSANLMSLTKVIVGKEVNIKNKVCTGKEVVANDTLSPPLGNNTNSENEFVLFFSVDYFGIVAKRK